MAPKAAVHFTDLVDQYDCPDGPAICHQAGEVVVTHTPEFVTCGHCRMRLRKRAGKSGYGNRRGRTR